MHLLLILPILMLGYSYFWLDRPIYLMLAETKSWLVNFEPMWEFARVNRELMANFYTGFILILFLVQLYVFFGKKVVDNRLLFAWSIIFSLAYNFLSYDVFTYLFSGKMVLLYGANPFVVAPKEFFETDLWLRFMRNIEFPYRYGPMYLLFTLIPMTILGPTRLMANFFFLKIVSGVIFYLTGKMLLDAGIKRNLVYALWFFNPLLIIELLVNTHNELLMYSLFMFGLILIGKKKIKTGWIFWGLSVATKYVSLIAMPILAVKEKYREKFLKLICITLFVYLSLIARRAIHPWYYTWIIMFLPFVKLKRTSWIGVMMIGTIYTWEYAKFIRHNSWPMGVEIWPKIAMGIFGLILINELRMGINRSKINLDIIR